MRERKWVTNSADFHRAYKETQIWANTQTANMALFMVDPCRGYGWRDFSGRASLGTVREWYMTAWIYSDRGDLLKRGHEIAQTLGFDMEPFRNAPGSNRPICAAARSAYYDPTLEPQVSLADKYGVNYFVFEKQFAADFPSELQARADFQNEHFLVISAERLK